MIGSRFIRGRPHPLAVVDAIRRWWLWRLGGLGRVLVRNRELRVALVFSAVIGSALLGTLVFPLWLLALGPMVWGVPHLVADFRYLVVRPGYGNRRILWVVGGIPLLAIAVGGPLVWGFVGTAAVALCARGSRAWRVIACAAMLALGGLAMSAGTLADVVFGHVHNFAAVGLWWLWRRRTGRVHWLPIVLLAAATALLLSPDPAAVVRAFGGLGWHPAHEGATVQLWRLAPRAGPDIGLRLVLLFCFMQSVHYAVWMVLIPDEAQTRATVMTFRKSYEDLRRDLGSGAIVVTGLLAVSLAAWALWDLAAAGRGYFRVARFHGHLELMAGCLLLLERKSASRRRG
ncbi:MAG: hypothetical protein AAF721_36610 [Myxococcota bacterium]